MNEMLNAELGALLRRVIEQVADAAADRAIARMRAELEKKPPEREPLLSKSDLAGELRVSPATVDRLVRQGLPFIQIGGGKRFRHSDALAWLEEHKRAAAAIPAPPRDDLMKGVRLLSRPPRK